MRDETLKSGEFLLGVTSDGKIWVSSQGDFVRYLALKSEPRGLEILGIGPGDVLKIKRVFKKRFDGK